jgi:metallo-beta-lactamase class B
MNRSIMNTIIKTLLVFVILITNFKDGVSQKRAVFNSKLVYRSKNLVVTQIAPNSFLHTSYKQTNDFGNVPCNGLLVRNSSEAIVFDTPTNNESANELIQWIKKFLHCKINAIIPTHFHDDCLGGLKAFHDSDIPSYAYFKTIELAIKDSAVVPKNSFNDSLILKIGSKFIVAKFFGEGHTKDNIVGYFPSDNILFGGCLIKELEAGKGYLGDANIADWSSTVEKVKSQYPTIKIVVPGHGDYGNEKLLNYTIQLFKIQK